VALKKQMSEEDHVYGKTPIQRIYAKSCLSYICFIDFTKSYGNRSFLHFPLHIDFLAYIRFIDFLAYFHRFFGVYMPKNL